MKYFVVYSIQLCIYIYIYHILLKIKRSFVVYMHVSSGSFHICSSFDVKFARLLVTLSVKSLLIYWKFDTNLFLLICETRDWFWLANLTETNYRILWLERYFKCDVTQCIITHRVTRKSICTSTSSLGGMRHISIIMFIKVYYNKNTFTCLEFSNITIYV